MNVAVYLHPVQPKTWGCDQSTHIFLNLNQIKLKQMKQKNFLHSKTFTILLVAIIVIIGMIIIYPLHTL